MVGWKLKSVFLSLQIHVPWSFWSLNPFQIMIFKIWKDQETSRFIREWNFLMISIKFIWKLGYFSMNFLSSHSDHSETTVYKLDGHWNVSVIYLAARWEIHYFFLNSGGKSSFTRKSSESLGSSGLENQGNRGKNK